MAALQPAIRQACGCQESCENAPCHLTCKQHTSFQKCNISAEVQGGRHCSLSIPPANHTSFKDIRPLSDAKGLSCVNLLVETEQQALGSQKREENKALQHCSARAWLAPFAPLPRPQNLYGFLQTGEAPSHRVGAGGSPGEKSKHRQT